MEEKLPYLTANELETYKMCVANIGDKIKSLSNEAKRSKPYKHYIKEKADSISFDINVILNMLDY